MAKHILFEEIYDGVLCEAAESFEAEINVTNKAEEEAEQSRSLVLPSYRRATSTLSLTVPSHKPPRIQQNGV